MNSTLGRDAFDALSGAAAINATGKRIARHAARADRRAVTPVLATASRSRGRAPVLPTRQDSFDAVFKFTMAAGIFLSGIGAPVSIIRHPLTLKIKLAKRFGTPRFTPFYPFSFSR